VSGSRAKRVNTRLVAVGLVLVIALVGSGLLIWTAVRGGGGSKVVGPPCRVGPYGLDLEQADHAATIAAVGKRMGLPDRAVSIALATAYLESRLHNLTHGDRDSLGLFQQRPSQGWGTPAQILTPHIAAASFFRRLARVPGWQVIPVTQAAQQVQRSAVPNGYAQFEPEARAIAAALVGEEAAGLTCRVKITKGVPGVGLEPAMRTELGVRTLADPLPFARGWTVASWLVAHAATYKIASVGFDHQRWTAASGVWKPDPSAGSIVQVALTATGVE
jgi:hypothetical protein